MYSAHKKLNKNKKRKYSKNAQKTLYINREF